MWTTHKSWSRRQRVVGKAEWTNGEANPRFVVTSLSPAECGARYLYENVYCARGDMENVDRTSIVLEVVSAMHLVADLTLALGEVVHDYLAQSEPLH
jgi:hypothetical protein